MNDRDCHRLIYIKPLLFNEEFSSVRITRNARLENVFVSTARRLFTGDRDCPTAYEPGGSDFLSPCLEEAALMAGVMTPEEFPDWLSEFLPPFDAAEFESIRSPVPLPNETMPPGAAGDVVTNDSLRAELGSRSHLIGLAFTRAEAMLRIRAALPADDPRGSELAELAALHAEAGFEAMFDADYAGSHWIGSFALKYLTGPGHSPSNRVP